MEVLTLAALLFVGILVLNAREQRRRIGLLASHLGQFEIEKMMESLTEGYLRCLDEKDPARREQIWSILDGTEKKLARQFTRFAMDFGAVDESQTQTSKLSLGLPVLLPLLRRVWPACAFDMRRVLAVHARGIADTAENLAGRNAKQKAYTLSAELFLMQHSCHWFCRSKALASARMMARHKTPYAQLLDSVSPATRRAYQAIVGV